MSSKKDWFIEAIKKGFIKSFDYSSFEAFKPIAKGGFGIVSKAYLKDADKVVALKCLYDGPTKDNEESFDGFIREVRNIAKVDYHDNIIGITQVMVPGLDNYENDDLGAHDRRIYASSQQIYSIVQRFQQLTVVDQDSPNVDESNDLQTNHNEDVDNVSVIQESNSSEIPNADAPNIFNDGQEADLIDISETSILTSSNET
ncbi:20840_t:CDS:2, partial [Racocetra persica]